MTNGFFTKHEVYDILDNSNNKLGIDIVTYTVYKVLDTLNLTNADAYSIRVKHRILVSGINWGPGKNYQASGFIKYPVMINVQSGIVETSQADTKIGLKRIFPKTINATVEQSSNFSTGNSSSQSNQTTTGSSSANVNTFGVDISAGWFVDGPVATIGVNYSHSWEDGTSRSSSAAASSAANQQSASGNEMSVKDWSAYSSVQNFNNTSNDYIGEFIQWDWGQTYPWSVFDYNITGSGSDILLPESVVANLLYHGSSNIAAESNILLPPSDLSLFGLDFTMASEWQLTFPNGLTAIESLKFQHQVSVLQASHSMTVPSGGGKATLVANLTTGYNNIFVQEEHMSIGKYALVPLSDAQRSGIGFQSNLFDIAPASPSTIFKIRSRGNDLLVTGTGFYPGMSALFPANYSGSGASLDVAFKVADLNAQYDFVLKHWTGKNSGNILLTCTINGNKTVINVTEHEGQGSSNNTSQLDLRNLDLKSANFHDYLLTGWNEISITVMPIDKTVASEYVVLALSIEG